MRQCKPVEPYVLVAGGGPVGLTAALRLALAGVPVLVVEQEPYSKTDWRASTFHCATLEVLEPLGVTPDMVRQGLHAREYQIGERRGPLKARFDFGLMADETAYPYRLQLNQQHLVRMLLDRLKETPAAEVRFGAQLTAFEQDGSGVTTTITCGSQRESVRASFLFAADGASSTVRRILGVQFEGMTYQERFLIVSIAEALDDLMAGLCYVNYLADPEEFLFILRTPESWRVLFPVEPDESDAAALGAARIEATLQRVAPNAAPYRVLDRQIYRVHQRVAEALVNGRVLLMGDAAHVNSPMGGVGLNSGIHDAMDASERVLRIRDGASALPELEAYDAVRRHVAREYVQADTHRNTMLMKERDPDRLRAEIERLAAISADPDQCRAFLRRISLLEGVRRYGIGRPAAEWLNQAALSSQP